LIGVVDFQFFFRLIDALFSIGDLFFQALFLLDQFVEFFFLVFEHQFFGFLLQFDFAHTSTAAKLAQPLFKSVNFVGVLATGQKSTAQINPNYDFRLFVALGKSGVNVQQVGADGGYGSVVGKYLVGFAVFFGFSFGILQIVDPQTFSFFGVQIADVHGKARFGTLTHGAFVFLNVLSQQGGHGK